MVHQDTHYYLYKKEFTNQASAKKQLIDVKRELSFQQVICYLSFRWVNISQAWTVYSVNITTFPFHASKPNVYSSASQASSLEFFSFLQISNLAFLTNCKQVKVRFGSRGNCCN